LPSPTWDPSSGPKSFDYSNNAELKSTISFSGPLTYVALGDSYSSGEGNPPFEGGKCDRSTTDAYPVLLNKQLGTDPSVPYFFACSGAKIADILSNSQYAGVPPQIENVDTSTALITLSIGGNDAGFAPILKICLKDAVAHLLLRKECKDDKHVKQLWADGYARVKNELPNLLDELHKAAPLAKILLVGYPNFFPQVGACRPGSGTLHKVAIDEADVAWLHDRVSSLDSLLDGTATAKGAIFVHPWSGHYICLPGKDSWFVHVDLKHLLTPAVFFHPDADGQKALFKKVLQALQQ
jgi:lysophospholipase L1-like esterase